jgi:integrase
MKKRIGIREVRALKPMSVLWDTTVIGFGARRQRSEARIFFLQYRTQAGRQRWYKIGRFESPWQPDTARTEALRLLGDIAHGGDPSAGRSEIRHGSLTVAQLCERYLADAKAGKIMRKGRAKKPSTIATDENRINKHVIPLLGSLSVSAVTQDEIREFMHAVAGRGGKGTATRTVNMLGGIFTYSKRPNNPVKGVERFAEGKRDRRLSDDEYRMLGIALTKAVDAKIWPAAIDAVRFIALTGWRAGEVLALRWMDLDLPRRTAILPDTKTGRSMRPLSRAACDLLSGLPVDGDLVFKGPPRVSMQWLKVRWRSIAGDLPVDVTMHTLRHSFASLANDLGFSEPTIAALLGHQGRSVTSRYVHSADATLLAAADAVAGKIGEMMR